MNHAFPKDVQKTKLLECITMLKCKHKHTVIVFMFSQDHTAGSYIVNL